MMDDVDVTCMKTVETFRNHPLLPKDVVVGGWVWEVETRALIIVWSTCRIVGRDSAVTF